MLKDCSNLIECRLEMVNMYVELSSSWQVPSFVTHHDPPLQIRIAGHIDWNAATVSKPDQCHCQARRPRAKPQGILASLAGSAQNAHAVSRLSLPHTLQCSNNALPQRSHELKILQKLFRVQMALSRYQFRECTFLSFQCKSELDEWLELLTECLLPQKVCDADPISRSLAYLLTLQQTGRKDDKKKLQCGVYTWLREFSQVVHEPNINFPSVGD